MTLPPGALIAAAILVLTLALVLSRPWGLPEPVAAVAGAAAALLSGVAAPGDLRAGVQDTAGVLVFLVAVMVLAGLAEAAGVFRWAAGYTLLTARGRGWVLFVNVYLLGALITLFLSLDVTAIVLTPLVCALVLPLRLDARPFVFACAFVANTASLALPVSNLTNMLVYGLLGVRFWDFVRYLALPNLVAMALNLGLLLWLFWRRLPAELRVSAADHYRVPASPFFRVSLALLGGTVLALMAAGLLGQPFWPPAVVGAGALAVVAVGRGWVGGRAVLRTVAWGLPPFVVGMYVVVAGVYRSLAPLLAGLPALAGALPGPLPLLAAAGATALGANAVNNLPLSLAAIQLLRTVPPGAVTAGLSGLRDTLAFGTLLGVNLGPNLTVTGSLATMLCLASARRQGIHVGALEFIRTGALVTPPMLLAAGLCAWALLR